MQEMIAFAKHALSPDASGITLRENPDDAPGLQFLLHTRIFIFETGGCSLKIDMATQIVDADTIAIVPPLHLHYLEHLPGHNFLCIDIDEQALDAPLRQLLYAVKYRKEKSFAAAAAYDQWAAIARSYPEQQSPHSEIKKWLEEKLLEKRPPGGNMRDTEYTRAAGQFLDLLSHRRITTDLCRVHWIASELCHSERTLHRIFINAFGLGAKSVLNYHLAMKGVYLLAEPTQSITDVAREMNFSSVGVFGRYMKKYTGYTPSALREQFFHKRRITVRFPA